MELQELKLHSSPGLWWGAAGVEGPPVASVADSGALAGLGGWGSGRRPADRCRTENWLSCQLWSSSCALAEGLLCKAQ